MKSSAIDIRVHKPLHGFTLVELLVVVSIIALLVSILLPALSKAREQAKRVVCATNLRQIGLLMQYYAEDNNGRFPKGYSTWYIYASSNYKFDYDGDGKDDPPTGLLALLPYAYNSNGGGDSWASIGELKNQDGLERMNIFWCPSGAIQFTELAFGGAFGNFGYSQYSGQTGATIKVGKEAKQWQTLDNCPEKNTDPSSWITYTDVAFEGFPMLSWLRSNHKKDIMGSSRGVGFTKQGCTGSNSLHVDGHVTWNTESEMNDEENLVQIEIIPGLSIGLAERTSWWLFPRTR